jgi:hypothetical protein
MQVRCAWCGLDFGLVEPLADRRVTHGICTPCSNRFLEQAGVVGLTKETPEVNPTRCALRGGGPVASPRERGTPLAPLPHMPIPAH